MIVSFATVAAACILVCFFAATHSVLKTYSRKRLGDLLEEQGREARLQSVIDHEAGLLMVTGLLRAALGLVVVLAVLAALQNQPTDSVIPSRWTPLVAFLIAIGLLAVFAVAIPVSWARYREERLLAWSIPILLGLGVLLLPVIKLMSLFDPIVRRISGVDLHDDTDDMADQIIAAVEDHEEGDTVAEDQKQMIEAVFDLADTDAGEIMTPRTDVQGIEVSSTFHQVMNAVLEFGHSRVPVYRDNLDEIVGILYAKDLIQLLQGDTDLPPSQRLADQRFDLPSLLREPFLVPESKKVLELLQEFRATKVHMAIVLDEYGGTAGLITIEDILEEIVGEIQDEYEPGDDEPTIELAEEKGKARVDARVSVHDLNDELDLDLPEDEDYDTVGGFVFATLGHIPETGESFESHGVKVTVADAERTKVIAVTVEKLEAVGEVKAS